MTCWKKIDDYMYIDISAYSIFKIEQEKTRFNSINIKEFQVWGYLKSGLGNKQLVETFDEEDAAIDFLNNLNLEMVIDRESLNVKLDGK